MKIGIPAEIHEDENRIAFAPESVAELKKMNIDVIIESGAGEKSGFPDKAYIDAGAFITGNAKELWNASDIVIKVRPPEMNLKLGVHEADLLKENGSVISLIYPARNKELLEKLATKKITSLAMDMIPRITTAQKMDVLSSMANVAGYRAVIEAAAGFGRFFTGQITAAGKIPPAKVLVIGAGVAGLSALGTARSLGAIVRAFDTRPEVKDQVKSMGAEFLELNFVEDGSGEGGYGKAMSPEFIRAEMELFMEQAREVDIIITTALVPGANAPVLITSEMVHAMKEGSVIVDMAAEQGGNCELTKPGTINIVNGVKIIGYTDLASRLANQASRLYGTNMIHLLKHMKAEEGWNVNMEDDIIRGALVTSNGMIKYPPPKSPVTACTADSIKKPAEEAPAQEKMPLNVRRSGVLTGTAMTVAVSAFAASIGLYAPPSFLAHFTVFVLAVFVGWMVIWKVTPALHTPLMSVTNAISGIIIIGAMLQISGPISSISTIMAAVAVFAASINIAGGFLVTRRMLRMFRK